jgi:hypothetical protein
MVLYGDVVICSLEPRAISFSAVRARSAARIYTWRRPSPFERVDGCEAEEYCRYAFRERKKVEGFLGYHM